MQKNDAKNYFKYKKIALKIYRKMILVLLNIVKLFFFFILINFYFATFTTSTRIFRSTLRFSFTFSDQGHLL